MNLVENALKFTERGSVTVEVIVDPATSIPIRIDVTDTGIGIPAEDLDEIFEPFHQLETGSSRRFGGAGLGLSICRSICDLLGYDLLVRSEPSRGSTFSIVLTGQVDRLPLSA